MKIPMTSLACAARRFIHWSAALATLSAAAHTQGHHPPGHGAEQLADNLAGAYEIEGGKASVEIPFEIISGVVVLSMELRGERFGIALDTGMPMPGLILTHTADVEALGLEAEWSTEIGGASGSSASVAFARGEELVLGDLTLRNLDVGLRNPEAGTALGLGVGGIEGIIGYSIFAPFIVRLDFDRMIVTLSEPGAIAPPAEGSLPLAIRHGEPFLKAEVTLPDGASAELEMVLDLGNSAGLMLNVEDIEELSAPRRDRDSAIGVGFKSEFRGIPGRISELKVGPFTLGEMSAAFTTSRFPTAGSNGNIGISNLRRFNLIIDYPGERLGLQPNSAYYTGAVIGTSDGRLFVKRLLLDSPAEAAGIAVGDEIVRVDGESVLERGSAGVLALLCRTGAEVWIDTDRAGLQQVTSLVLR